MRNTEKCGKWKNAHCRFWNMVRKLKNVENETKKNFQLEYGKKFSKMRKMRNAHCMTWSMAIKLKIMKNEKHTL
jgi:hypothetical protein